jgi:hypothetical protein
MHRFFRRGTVLAVVLIWAAGLAGCGTLERSYKAVSEKGHQALRWYKSPGDDLVKKVGVAWFLNQSGYAAADFEATFTGLLVERLRNESSDLQVIGPAEPGAPELLDSLPKTADGRIDNLQIALLARRAGLNAVVVGSLVDVRDRRQEKGIWWFKDVYDAIEATINLEVYDSHTAAKMIDERFTLQFEAEIPLIMPDQPASTNLPPQVIEEIESMLTPLARKIADAAVTQPWVGFIHEVSGALVTLTVGAGSGLEPGDVLEVLDNSKVIQGMQDVHFFVPGLKVGEIEVTAASAERIEARILSGQQIWSGSPVKLKP